MQLDYMSKIYFTSFTINFAVLLSPGKEVELPNKKNGAKNTSQSSVIIIVLKASPRRRLGDA